MDSCNELRIKAWIERLITERAGMEAANSERARKGEAQAYPEVEFQKLCDEFACIEEQVISIS